MRTTILAIAAGLCAALFAACSPVDDPAASTEADRSRTQLLEAVRANAKSDAAENCLLLIWSDQEEPDVEYDRANDRAKGGAISCATGTSASQFRAAIETLRDTAKRGDRAGLLREIGFPMLYIDGEGNRRELTERQIDAAFDEVFDARVLDALGRLDMSDITVRNDQGAFFQLGTLWLVVDRQGGRPRLVTVNRQALDEAVRTARQQAESGIGEGLPQRN